MKMKKNSILKSIVFAIAVTMFTGTAMANVIYTEEFINTTTSDINVTAVGWNLYGGANVVAMAPSGTSKGAIQAGDYAYFISGSSSSEKGLFYTEEPGDVAVGGLTKISFTQRMDGSVADPANARFVIRMGSSWYASDTEIVSTDQHSTYAPEQIAIDFTDGSKWRALTFVIGSEITVGASTVGGTLSGNVDAFGLYAESGNSGDHFRIDDYTIEAIPGSVSVIEVIYQQPFTGAGAMTNVGWNALALRSLTLLNVDASADTGQAGINNYGFFWPDSYAPSDPSGNLTSAGPGLFYTEAAEIQTDVTLLEQVSFDYIGDPTNASYRVAVKVGGQWVAQAAETVDGRDNPGTAGGFLSAVFEPADFASATNWLTVSNAAVGSAVMTLGAVPASDLSGTVQAIGLYLENATDHMRFDDFSVTTGALPGYEGWAGLYGLTTGVNDGLLDDVESGGGDGANNLLEYALNGDPLADDAAGIQPVSFAVGDWFYYVHNERTDDDSLNYTVQLDDDLVADPTWSTNGVVWVGDSAVDGNGFKTATNRTDIGNAEFIRLQVQMD